MRLLLPALGLALGSPSWAQSVPAEVLRAANSAFTSPLPAYQPLPAAGASALVRERQDWREANATVGQFPRGHQDLVRWERAHGLGGALQPAPAPASTAAHPEHAR